MIAIIVLGLLAISGTGECAITSWTTPVQAGTGGQVATAILTLAEGYTGDFITFVAVSTDAPPIASYAIVTQTPASIFQLSTAGVLTLAASQVLDYESHKTHVLEIEATDSTATTALKGTATVTISVTNVAPAFITTKQTIEIPDATAASTTVATLTAIDVGSTITYAITAAGNTNTDFGISSAGVVTTLNALAVGTTSSYTLEITAADNVATIATGTATLVVCVGTCPATGSGAAGLAAGILSLITLAVTMLK